MLFAPLAGWRHVNLADNDPLHAKLHQIQFRQRKISRGMIAVTAMRPNP